MYILSNVHGLSIFLTDSTNEGTFYISRLKIHMEYVRTVMPNWVTKEQKRKGIDADYLFSAITANWERKRPIWVTLLGTIHILHKHLYSTKVDLTT